MSDDSEDHWRTPSESERGSTHSWGLTMEIGPGTQMGECSKCHERRYRDISREGIISAWYCLLDRRITKCLECFEVQMETVLG